MLETSDGPIRKQSLPVGNSPVHQLNDKPTAPRPEAIFDLDLFLKVLLICIIYGGFIFGQCNEHGRVKNNTIQMFN